MFRRDFFKGLFGGAALELPEVKSAEILRLQDGDTIVLTVERPLSMEQAAQIKALLEAKFPKNRAMVLERGMEVSVIKG